MSECVICGSTDGLRPVLRLQDRTMRPILPETQVLDLAGGRMWVCSSPASECVQRGGLRQRRLREVHDIKLGRARR